MINTPGFIITGEAEPFDYFWCQKVHINADVLCSDCFNGEINFDCDQIPLVLARI
jgi:hypothetical protein